VNTKTRVTSSPPNACACAGVPVRKSGGRLAAGAAIALALIAMLVWGETWAIEHAPMTVERCVATLSGELARVFDDVCNNSGAPIAIIH
jgi:hypothetical protein